MGVQMIAKYSLYFPSTLYELRCGKCREISLTTKIGRVNSILMEVNNFLSALSRSIWMQVGIRGTHKMLENRCGAGCALLRSQSINTFIYVL